MIFYPHQKVALLVDGPNLFGAGRALGLEPDYAKLRGYFANQCMLVSATYFGKVPDEDEYSPVRRLADWMDFNRWQTAIWPKDPDVWLAVAAMEMAPRLDHIILVTGDSDFVPLVEALQRQACTVTVVSTINAHGQGFSCADSLRRAADQFLDLHDLREAIGRPSKELASA